MIGLDTNVLARCIAQDDPAQSLKATRLMEGLSVEAPGFVSLIALVATTWAPAGRNQSKRTDVAHIVEAILKTRELSVEQSETVWKALRLFVSSKADLADCLIERSGREAQCDYTATFDLSAAKTAGMRRID